MRQAEVGLKRRPGRDFAMLIAIGVCLALGLVLLGTGAAVALSGFASDEPAVHAQYPDASGSPGGPPGSTSSQGQSVIASLGDIGRVARMSQRTKSATRQWRASQHEVARRMTGMLESATGLAPGQSGSVVLLLAGAGVLSLGGLLRWRRGLAQGH